MLKTKVIYHILFLTLFLANNVSAQNNKILNEVRYACWQVKDYKISPKGVALEMEQITTFSQRRICLDELPIQLITDTIVNPKFSIRKMSDKTLWKDYFINKKFLGTVANVLYEIKVIESNPRKRFVNSYDFLFDGAYIYFLQDGVTFRLEKKDKVDKHLGAGASTKSFDLTGKETHLDVSYEFFTDPDELSVYDQDGKELFRSGMISTSKAISKTINLKNVTKLVFKIDSKASNSRWSFWFSTK